jgi:formylglycine-generating enzyme required for sulfatase activity
MTVTKTILTILVGFSMFSAVQSIGQESQHDWIKAENLLPPGTRFLREDRYLDETEISNIAWLEFLHYICRDSSNSYYESMLPDTTVWADLQIPLLQIQGYMGVVDTVQYSQYSSHYLRYPGSRYYPVIGISYYQAQEYCKWRSTAVTISQNAQLQRTEKNYRTTYHYTLPTISDLEYASRELTGKQKLSNKTARLISKISKEFRKDQTFWKAAVKQSIARNELGSEVFVSGVNIIGYIFDNANSLYFYNLIGNVSEMTDQEGISFGGSWLHTLEEIQALKTFPYRKPDYWLGFRCICSVEVTLIVNR